MPASALQPARPHAALFWLIRGTGALIAGFSAYALFETIWAFPSIMAHTVMSETVAWKISSFCFTLLFLLFEVTLVRIGYRMFRKVDAGAAAIFAFIFSFLTAVAFHHFLLRAPVLGQHPVGWPWSYRATLSLIVFLTFQRIINAYLLRILVFNTPNPPPNPPSSAPAGPFGHMDTILSPK